MSSHKTLYERALSLLARREHSAKELTVKLTKITPQPDKVHSVITKLVALGLQSDARFAESYVRHRADRGFGALRIKLELKQRGIATKWIDSAICQANIDWAALAHKVRCRRFDNHAPSDDKARAKAQRFLYQRGFSHEQIIKSLSDEK